MWLSMQKLGITCQNIFVNLEITLSCLYFWKIGCCCGYNARLAKRHYVKVFVCVLGYMLSVYWHSLNFSMRVLIKKGLGKTTKQVQVSHQYPWASFNIIYKYFILPAYVSWLGQTTKHIAGWYWVSNMQALQPTRNNEGSVYGIQLLCKENVWIGSV